MIAVTDKFKQELGERVTTSHSTDGEDEMVAYSSRISEYDITAEQHDADLAAPTFERWKEFEGRVEY